MENHDNRVSTQWEHSLTNLLGHDPTSEPGIVLRQWVLFQGVENILDLTRFTSKPKFSGY